MGSSGNKSLYCSAAAPITWSGKDSPDTVRQVKGYNAAYVAVCGRAR